MTATLFDAPLLVRRIGMVATVLVAAWLPAAAQETPKKGGTLIYALTNEPPHLNIAITTDLNAQQSATNIFSQLIRVEKDGTLTPWQPMGICAGADGSVCILTIAPFSLVRFGAEQVR